MYGTRYKYGTHLGSIDAGVEVKFNAPPHGRRGAGQRQTVATVEDGVHRRVERLTERRLLIGGGNAAETAAAAILLDGIAALFRL